ncbi:hypothetical protein Plhal304r1_c086g0169071 [Plasmopara halstedii]
MLHRDNGHLRPYGLVMSKVLCTQSVIHTYLLEAEQKDCTRKKETAKVLLVDGTIEERSFEDVIGHRKRVQKTF